MKREPEVYDFSAPPRVAGPKPKYRQDRTDLANLMNDPRVVRGNTYAAVVTTKSEFKKEQPSIKLRKSQNRQTKKTFSKFDFESGFEPTTPRAIDGREHFSIQTQAFVETLRDKPIEYEKQCQTDFYLDRPVERLFTPTQTGIDVGTQIMDGDPELFSFDTEVQPILDALLSKILDTSRYELFEQEELEQKHKHKLAFERTRNANLAEIQKLESNQSRTQDQQQRRQLQFKKTRQQNSFTQKKLIGRILSKQYMKNLQRNTNMILQQQGFFRQPLEFDLYDNFVPWLYQQIQSDITEQQQLRAHTGEIVHGFQSDFAKKHADSIKAEEKRRSDIETARKEEAERKLREKQERKAKKEAEEAERKAQEEAAAAAAQAQDPPAPAVAP